MGGDAGRPWSTAAESWQSYRYLADNAIDVVLEADRQTVMLWVSPSVADVLGWQPDELVGRAAPEIVHPDDMGEIMVLAEAINAGAGRVRAARCRMLGADGRYRPMQLRGRPSLGTDGEVVGHIISMQDTGELDAAMRGLAILSECNRVLARAGGVADLRTQMCETVVKSGHYAAAWYGRRASGESASVEVVARAGDPSLATEELPPAWGERTLTWASSATGAGSSISLPVFVAGELDGALVVSSDDAGAFDPAVQELLETLVSDLGFGLERFASARRIAESEARYRLLAENASDVVWQVAADETIAWISESVSRVLGWPADHAIGRPYTDLIHPDDRPQAVLRHHEHLLGHTTHGEFRLVGADGATRWMTGVTRPVHTGAEVSCITSMRDIEDEMRARMDLEHAMGHDLVTGLPNRQTMMQRIEAAIAQADTTDVGVLSIGVDALTPINDAYTHAAGDVVLTTVATRIATAVGDPDHIGRGTGDEFVVLVHGQDDASASAVALAEEIRRAVREPIPLHSGTVSVTVSIGIATGEVDADPRRLLTDAGLALRRAKEHGRDRIAFADAGLAAEAQRRLGVESEIRAGLAAGEFVPWFQPIVDLATVELAGYEALVRWVRDGEVVAPDQFLPHAERTSLIVELDQQVLERSVEVLATLPPEQFVSVNVSSATLTRPTYADHVVTVLTRLGVEPSRLHLEVTETSLLSMSEGVLDVIRRIAALGVQWYVDDFGTGYSSISHLRDLPVSGMKLDTSFTSGIGRGDMTSRRLAQALAGLAEGLELTTIAEGVETQGEASTLVLQGWRYGQGWLFGRATPAP